MNRTKTNYCIDALALITLVLLASTGLVERYLLPPGTGHFKVLWNMTRHQWGEIHFWIAMLLLAVLTIHIALHWKWIACVTKGRKPATSRGRIWVALMGVVGLVMLSLTPFLSQVESSGEIGGHRKEAINTTQELHRESEIKGSLSLLEMESLTGVETEVLLMAIDLPEDTPGRTKLGQLRRQADLSMLELRRVIEELIEVAF